MRISLAIVVIAFAGCAPAGSRWEGYNNRLVPDNPPVTSTLAANEETLYNLPAASLNVVRGNLIAVKGP